MSQIPGHGAESYGKLGFEIVGARTDVGSVVIGKKDLGRIIVWLPGEAPCHPDRLQINFAAKDVDAAFERLSEAGVEISRTSKG